MPATVGLVAVCSDLVGSVLSVELGVGARVEAASVVAVIESMKMEIPILAETAGQVHSIHVVERDQVDAGSVVAWIEPVL
jgi:acetyl-CoA carboxylase biotin carboxyl carrier protein